MGLAYSLRLPSVDIDPNSYVSKKDIAQILRGSRHIFTQAYPPTKRRSVIDVTELQQRCRQQGVISCRLMFPGLVQDPTDMHLSRLNFYINNQGKITRVVAR